jgi:hypothetical protein
MIAVAVRAWVAMRAECACGRTHHRIYSRRARSVAPEGSAWAGA